jgi:hypothetical protein
MTPTTVELSAFALLGLGLAAILVLFLSLRRDLRLHIRTQRAECSEMKVQLQEEIQRSATLRQALGQKPPAPAAWAAPPSAFNINKRIRPIACCGAGTMQRISPRLSGFPAAKPSSWPGFTGLCREFRRKRAELSS